MKLKYVLETGREKTPAFYMLKKGRLRMYGDNIKSGSSGNPDSGYCGAESGG
jgi:hypothetical protein